MNTMNVLIIAIVAALTANALRLLPASTDLPVRSGLVHGTRLLDRPVLSFAQNTSVFPYTYNPSWIEPTAATNYTGCLLIRCQNYSSPDKWQPGPSRMALSCETKPDSLTDFQSIERSSVVFEPSTPQEALGTEDPRVKLINDTYFMFYTAVELDHSSGNWIARLSLATTTNPMVKSSWVRHGALFPDPVNGFQFTKSAALLVGDKKSASDSFLIFGDCTLYNGLQVAVPTDDTFLKYRVIEDILLVERRRHSFDSELVESGPPPMRLNSGNWLFIYNAAQRLYGVPNKLLYNPGWVILNGSNPLEVLDRSDEPFTQPSYRWETHGLTPYVMFVEAMRRDPTASGDNNTFVVYYGSADTGVGAMRIVVKEGTSSARRASVRRI